MFPEDLVAPSPPLGADGRQVYANSSFAGNLARPWFAQRYWLHIGLLVATLWTTSLVGSRMQQDFQANLPLRFEDISEAFGNGWREPARLMEGIPFSLTLLTILLAHEFGHFLTCVRYRIDASLPYFLPAPTLIGTFGAFIRIRAPIYLRRALFDVAVGGPVAGFIVLVPALAIGVAFSKVIPGIEGEGNLRFGTPLLLRLMELAIFPGVASSDIYLHPVARAAWGGMLATAYNLIPASQLDGGHVLYLLSEKWHAALGWVLLCGLAVLGVSYWPWWLLAVLLYFFRRHPPVYDSQDLGPGRRKLAWLMLLLFILCFTPAPVSENPGV